MERLGSTQKKTVALASIKLVVVTIIRGSGFIATELAMNAGWSPTPLMALRFSLAAIILAVFLRKKIFTITKIGWFWGAWAGVFIFIAFFLQTIGQSMTTVSNTAFFTATNVIMIPFISWVLTKKRPGAQTIILAVLTVIGVAILNYQDGVFSMSVGDAMVIACAFFLRCIFPYSKKQHLLNTLILLTSCKFLLQPCWL